MSGMRSTYARRKLTGRKPKHVRIRRKAAHTRRVRRYRGIRTQPKGASERNYLRAMAMVAARRALQPSHAVLSARARAAALAKAKGNVVKKSPKKSAKKPVVTQGTAISAQSYINMFS